MIWLKNKKKYQDTAIKYIFKLLYINFCTRSIKQSDLETQFPSHISFFKTWYGIYIFLCRDNTSQTAIKYTLKSKYTFQTILSTFIFYFSRRKHKLYY